MVGRFNDAFLDEVRARSDIVAVVGEYVPLRRRGGNYVGLCPFHQEKTPSFTVTPDKQMFYCFGCQTGGNVFTFLMKREGLSFAEAVEQMAARAGVPLPEPAGRPRSPSAQAAEDRRKREVELLYRILAFAARYYHQSLLKSAEAEKARAYLQRRGVKPESAEIFGLGYSPKSWDALTRVLMAKGVSAAVLEKAGLALGGREDGGGSPPGTGGVDQSSHHDRFRGRLMFAIADQRGRPIGFGARALEEGDEPKYLNSPETPLFSKGRALYALHLAAPSIRRAGRAVVVEGYLDALACHEFGFDYTVASMGTAFTTDQARVLRRLTDTVVTAFDADTAGTRATLRGLEILTAAGFRVKVAEIPGGKDPDECLRGDGGPEAFRRAIEEAVPLVEYRFRLAERQHDPRTIEGRVAVVKDLVPVLAGIEGPVEGQEYVRDFARRLSVPEEALRKEITHYLQTVGDSRRGVKDSIARWRNNKETLASLDGEATPPGSGPARLPKRVRDAERALLGRMVASDEELTEVLAGLVAAVVWCGEVGLTAPGGTDDEAGAAAAEAAVTGEVAAAAEAAVSAEAGADQAGTASEGEPAEVLTPSEIAALDWFTAPLHRRIARTILHLARAEELVRPAELVDALGEDDAGSEAVARIVFEAEALRGEPQRAIRDCLGVLKEHRLNSRIDELRRRITDLEQRAARLAAENQRSRQDSEEYAEVERILLDLIRELIDLERHTDGGAGHWRVPRS